jgi:two-component system sensor histidine kinase MtrB
VTIRRHRRLSGSFVARFRGLRPRLVVVFVLVALVSGGTAAGVSYVSARNAILDAAQQAVLTDTRDELNQAARELTYPLDQAALETVAAALPRGERLVLYRDLQAPAGPDVPTIPAGLRRAVREDNRLVWQRVERDGVAQLVVGSPLMTFDEKPSGVEAYLMVDLGVQQGQVDELADSALRTLGLSLLVAIVVALLAARGVLRPVRDLRAAARQLAAGKLDTRLRVRGADELADLVMTFNNTAVDLERSVAALRRMEANARQFVADVSHELRTPLAAMTAVTDTLDEEAAAFDGDAGTAARLVSSETRRLATLVENLIEISRFDAGRAALRIDEDVDLAEAVDACLAARGWTGEVLTDLPAGIVVDVDRRRFDVIVANLAGNALRHGAAPVTVTAGVGGGVVTVTVTDCGQGLPDGGARVFERFYKADSSRARSEGSGLGLAIALENARLHGGTLVAANRPEGGAAFTLRLPLHVDAPVGAR